MAKNNYWLLKADPMLKKKFDYVIEERIRTGKSTISDVKTKKLTYQRLSLATARDDKLINDLINATLI